MVRVVLNMRGQQADHNKPTDWTAAWLNMRKSNRWPFSFFSCSSLRLHETAVCEGMRRGDRGEKRRRGVVGEGTGKT